VCVPSYLTGKCAGGGASTPLLSKGAIAAVVAAVLSVLLLCCVAFYRCNATTSTRDPWDSGGFGVGGDDTFESKEGILYRGSERGSQRDSSVQQQSMQQHLLDQCSPRGDSGGCTDQCSTFSINAAAPSRLISVDYRASAQTIYGGDYVV
jgi:hypothetical protein